VFGTGTGSSDHKPDDDAVPESIRAAIADIQRGSSVATTAADRTGNIWLVRRVSQRTPAFGVIAIDLGSVRDDDVADIRHRVDGVLSDATATFEQLDVARALNEAKMRSETEQLREALIGSVSHELRTPLSSILGARNRAHAIADHRQGRASHLARHGRARRGGASQQRHPESARRHPHQPRTGQAAAGMDRAARYRQFGAERRRRRLAAHTVAIDMDTNLPFIYVDPVLVEQAFTQVIDNAAKYSPCGSTIKVAARRNGHDLIFSVNDTGAGLTDAEKSRIGERFFRGTRHAVTTSGSGLGFWIAKAFVAANGGKIEASSSGADLGTTVSIHLPLAPDAPQLEAGTDD
jgi:two-component system sensor histidine kinase KdpD